MTGLAKLSRRELLVAGGAALASPALAGAGPLASTGPWQSLPLPQQSSNKRGRIVLHRGTVLDGRGGRTPGASVVIDGNKIGQVSSGLTPQSGDQVIDCSGMTILPGMIDLHLHPAPANLRASAGYFSLLFMRNSFTILQAGFTSIRCLGTAEYVDLDVRRAAQEGLVTQPRIFAAGKGLGPTNTHLWRLNVGLEVDGVENYRKAARALIKKKVDLLKMSADAMTSFATPTVAEMSAAAEVFHAAGKKVSVHAGTVMGIRRALEAGADTIEHGFLIGDDPALLEQMAQSGAYLVPTLYISERWDTTTDTRYSPAVLAAVRRYQKAHPESFAAAVRAGVRIAMGSDEGGIPGSPIGEGAYEIELMVRHGMKEMDAIVASTSHAADALGMGDRLGSLQPGMLADVIVVDGDPLQDIKVLGADRVKRVIADGRLVKDA